MYKSKRIVCVIPARLASTRFPHKVLTMLGEKPLLQWVYEAASDCEVFDEILFAVDALETKKLVESFGALAVMTSQALKNGTERLIEVKKQHGFHADVWINWQADEPFIEKEMILDLLQSIDQKGDVWTLRKKISEEVELHDPNVVKVVVDKEERALYFSRYPIPFYREFSSNVVKYKHIGLYAFSSKGLDEIANMNSCELEQAENLEQLRFLYYGLNLKAHETYFQTLGIDLPEHLQMAEQLMALRASRS